MPRQKLGIVASLFGIAVLSSQLYADVAPAAATPAPAPAPAATAAPAPAPAPAAALAEPQSIVDQIKNPAEFINWGMDLRVREEFLKNNIDFMSEFDDTRNVIRIRGRIWVTVGPFLQEPDLGSAMNGLKFFVRYTTEPRFYVQRSEVPPVMYREWEEAVLDNAYVEWDRILGSPFSIKAGRQDLVYGRGWLILDGTPLDGSRTIYSDAIKGTIELAKTSLDLVIVDNKADEERVEPLGSKNLLVNEYDTRMFIAWLRNSDLCPIMELNGYYILAQEDKVKPTKSLPMHRLTNVVGFLIQGDVIKNLNYYLESAYQWGSNGSVDRSAFGVNSDLRYKMPDVQFKPEVHIAYEFLTGDDPNSKQYEGWNPLLGRWPQWSEMWANRFAYETGQPAYYQNLHRLTMGPRISPIPNMAVSADYSLLWANQHTNGTSFLPPPPIPRPYASGYFRGQLVAAKASYKFNRYVDTELVAEYFTPGSFYDRRTDDAFYGRWQVNFTF